MLPDDDADAPETGQGPHRLIGPITLEAGAADAGLRLDRFLAQALPSVSRSRLKALILAGAVRGRQGVVADPGALEDPGAKVKPGDTFVVELPPPEASGLEGEAIPLVVVYEDDHLIVVDKPAGLVVHPAAGHAGGTLVNALVAHCGESLSGIGGVRRPGIVHRLDKDTSGLIVAAKTDAAHQGLSDQFQSHGADGRLTRAYLALVWGVPLRAKGRIEASLARSHKNRTKIAVTKGASGRHAVTHYEVIETYAGTAGKPVASLLRLTLETGRTHQIRVHLAHIGHPVMGDPVYGTGFKASSATLGPGARAALGQLGRQALHAVELGFEHPVSGINLSFTSNLPHDIAALREALKSGKS